MARAPSRRSMQRSPREWALRGGLAVAALALGYVSTTQTLAFAVGKSSAERAHGLAPGDGRIAAELAEQLAAGEADTAQRVRADRIARQAVADEPLAAPALTALALNAQLRGNTTQARRLFVHSDALSRRELGTRLWLIEDAVEREDIPGALRHYDIALRTSRMAPEILFPVLSVAIADPVVARALTDSLVARPPWGEAFINYLPRSSAEPDVSAQFFRRLAKSGVSIPERAQTNVINALVGAGEIEDAWSYYASLRSGAARERSRDPAFAAQIEAPSAFDWAPINSDTGISASIQHSRDGGIFDFAVPSTIGGAVLQQGQFLPAGRYRLEGVSRGIEQPPGARPYWQLTCAGGREAGRVELPNSADNDGRFAGEITVDADCRFQTLRLVARPSSMIGGVTGQIESVQLGMTTGQSR